MLSQTSLNLIIDHEALGNTERYNSIINKIGQYKDYFYSKNIKLTTNSYPSYVYHGNGHNRQQLLMFEADLYTDPSVEYIGFVDTDCLFVTYTDREDLFEGSKPVINGRIGNPQNGWWQPVPLSTSWLLSKPEPMRCMSYFPVIIKRSHLQDMRQYLMQLHQKNDFHQVFTEYSGKAFFSQFNAMCAYLWYFKRDDYVWYVHDTNPGQALAEVAGAISDRSIFSPSMFEPKPRISIHTRYHSRKNFDDIVIEGFCRSPPFPKSNVNHESMCQKYNLDDVFNEQHSFEEAEWWSTTAASSLKATHKLRHDRIKGCNFTHTYMHDSLQSLPK